MTKDQAKEAVRTGKEFIHAKTVHATSEGHFVINASVDAVERLKKSKHTVWLIKGTEPETVKNTDNVI